MRLGDGTSQTNGEQVVFPNFGLVTTTALGSLVIVIAQCQGSMAVNRPSLRA